MSTTCRPQKPCKYSETLVFDRTQFPPNKRSMRQIIYGFLKLMALLNYFEEKLQKKLFLSSLQVENEPTVYHQTQDNLLWSTKDLRIQVLASESSPSCSWTQLTISLSLSLLQILPGHFLNGQLILRCTAEVGTYYADFTEAPLETTRKEPQPQRGERTLKR